MRNFVIAVVLMGLLMLAACGNKTTGKRVAVPEPSGVTGAVTSPAAQSSAEVSKSAAEVLSEIKAQETGTVSVAAAPGAKSGTFYPPVKVTGTGKDALKEKTKALMSGGSTPPENVDAQGQFGAKYHDADGDSKNLPGEYGQGDAVD